MIREILTKYAIHEPVVMEPVSSGLINSTWKITVDDKQYILQKINHHVFRNPYDIAKNLELIDQWLKIHAPSYPFVAPMVTPEGENMCYSESDGYFRLFPFIQNSHTIDVVSKPDEAFEAATQFGKFTSVLRDFPVDTLNITIPDFHNLVLRNSQHQQALENGNPERIREAQPEINLIRKYHEINSEYQAITTQSDFKKRVTHHDTKISNVLFTKEGKGYSVIDLDTVMPGYFISDLGDMMRTYLSPVSEEEKDPGRIYIRKDIFQAIVHGYLGEMKSELGEVEKTKIIYSGKFMIYMQALRFLTDYLNDDIYYTTTYPGQNLVRAQNQLNLLGKLYEAEPVLEKFVNEKILSRSYLTS